MKIPQSLLAHESNYWVMNKILLLMVMVGFVVIVSTVATAGDFIIMKVRNIGATEHVSLYPHCIKFDPNTLNCLEFDTLDLGVYP